MQLRAVAVAQIAYHYRTDDRAADIRNVLGESIESYLERLKPAGPGAYTGDMLSLWFLSEHFRKSFFVWSPGGHPILIGSTLLHQTLPLRSFTCV